MKTKIDKYDVISIADQIGISYLTDKQLKKIVDEYEFNQRQDPTGAWNLVLEQQIYNCLN